MRSIVPEAVLAFYVLLISLVAFKAVSKRFRMAVLGAAVACVSLFVVFLRIPATDLGLRSDTASPAAIAYGIFTLLAAAALLLLSRRRAGQGTPSHWYRNPHLLFFFIPVSFAQQFLFQGVLLFELRTVLSPFLAILITAAVFGYLHVIYRDPLSSALVGFAGGVCFASLFVLFPNLIVASVSHSILNFTAVYCGFFGVDTGENAP